MSEPGSTSIDLYSILGVEKSAPFGAIHQAFIERLPRHRPDKDPEGFRAIQMAYHTLMDPRAREEYDNLMACGPDIADLMNGAFGAMIQGRPRLAEQLVTKIVDETGGASEAMMLLGMVQFEQGHFHDAVGTLGELVDRFPRVALYRVNLGNMLMNLYAGIEDDDAKAHVLRRAREQYERAIEIDPQSSYAYIEMAKTHHTEGDDEAAWQWTEKAVRANGREDFEDFDALLYGCMALTNLNDIDRVRNQILRLEKVVPDVEDARQFAVSALVSRTIPLVQDRRLAASRELVLAAIRLSPDSKELSEMLRDTDLALEADRSWDEFKRDPAIIPPLKEMADHLFRHFLLRSTEDRLEEAIGGFFDKLDGRTFPEVRRSLARMKRQYPSIWKLSEDFWANVQGLVGGRMRIKHLLFIFGLILAVLVVLILLGTFIPQLIVYLTH
jgi:tetratricopeptide (TPR) repeat protein